MMMFHQAPNGKVFVRVEGKDTYSGTTDDFLTEFGERPVLPPRVSERIYEPNKRHALMNDETILMGGPMPYDFGDRAIAAIDMLLQKQTEREDREIANQAQSLQPVANLSPTDRARITRQALRKHE